MQCEKSPRCRSRQPYRVLTLQVHPERAVTSTTPMPDAETTPQTGPVYVENPREIDNPILSFFLGYWRKKRGSNALPSRSDIRIKDFPQYLRWVVLLDAEEQFRDFRFRVVGSAVARYFLADATGQLLSEAYANARPGLFEFTRDLIANACNQRIPLRLTGEASNWDAHYFPNWDALYLPLGSDRHSASGIMIVFTFNYEEFARTRDPSAFQRF